MEKKKISLATILGIIAVIVIGFIAVAFVVQDNNNRKKAGDDGAKTSDQAKELENATGAQGETEDINIDGAFSFEASDLIYIFSSNGTVERGTSLSSTEGEYTTISKNEIEVHFTQETAYDMDTGKAMIKDINETEKFTYIDSNTLKSADGGTMTRLETTTNTSDVSYNDLDGIYSFGSSDEVYVFKGDGNITYSDNLIDKEGTYNISNDSLEIRFLRSSGADVNTNETTVKNIDEAYSFTIIDKNTLVFSDGGTLTKISER